MNYVQTPYDRLIESRESPEERLNYVSDVLRDTGCEQTGEGEKNLLEIRKALYQEVKSMEQEIPDKALITWYLMQVEQLQYGYEESARRHSERRKLILMMNTYRKYLFVAAVMSLDSQHVFAI